MPIQKVTKEEIIRKAVEIFQRQGYHKTSMSDLARACGLFKGSFYYYFKSKEELMREVLNAVHNYYNKKVFVMAYDETLDAGERLKKMFKKQEPIITQDYAGCLFGNLTLETLSTQVEFRNILKAFFSDWIKAFQYIFETKYDAEQAKTIAEQSVMEVEGAIMMMRLYDDKRLLYDACQRVLRHLD